MVVLFFCGVVYIYGDNMNCNDSGVCVVFVMGGVMGIGVSIFV